MKKAHVRRMEGQGHTPGKINMEPENGPLEDYFPLQLQPSCFQVLWWVSSRVYIELAI